MKIKPTMHNGINVIDLELVRSSKYDENIDRYGDHSKTCFFCARPTAQKSFVHLSTNGLLVPANIDENDLLKYDLESQGCFPVGAECAKKIGQEFIVYIK
jgi:hypothetical protein